MATKISAGLLMYRKTDKELEVFLVHPGGPFFKNKDVGVWTIPKGGIEDELADNYLSDARREFFEETGTEVKAQSFIDLGYVTLKSGKKVYGWAFEGELTAPFQSNTFEIEMPAGSGRTASFPEVDQGEFFDLKSAREKINPAQRLFLERLINLIS